MTRILIADDSQPVRCGLRALLGLNSDWEVCGEAVDGADAVKKAHQLLPDLILMDFSMPQMDGVQASREIAKSGTDIPILRHSEFHLNSWNWLATLGCGARFQSRKSASYHVRSWRFSAVRPSSIRPRRGSKWCARSRIGG
jgi:DNA-binding NarL/FixJ family response regulator